MIVDERIVTFINSLDTKNSELLEIIEKEARRDDVPIIRREMQSFLKVLLMLKRPVNILEVGTAVGFSALLMSESVPAGMPDHKRSRITRSGSRWQGRISARAGKEEQITLIEGDAADVLKTLEGSYDFILYGCGQRDSISTSCRRSCVCSRRAAVWCRIM